MRKVLLSCLAVALAVIVLGGTSAYPTHAAGVPPIGLVTPHFMSDSFAGPALDRNVWGWYGTNQPDNVAFAQSAGALSVSVASTATNDFNASLGTRCRVRGDFDATLSYRLVEWPARNGVSVSLMAADTGGFNVYRVSWLFGDGEAYGAYLPPAGTAVAASGDSGVLRLARNGSTWTGYYLSGRHWTPIVSGVGPTGDVALSPGVFNVSAATPFGGAATRVAFDGFHASAARVVCP
jgi:hypothetical protein